MAKRQTLARPAVGSYWRMAVCRNCGDDIANYGIGWVHRGIVGLSTDETCGR